MIGVIYMAESEKVKKLKGIFYKNKKIQERFYTGTELLPCPFCMSTAEIFCSMGNKTVRCSNKKCIAHNIMSAETEIEKEIDLWNMRVKSVTGYGKPFMENAITYFEQLAKKYKKAGERAWLIGKSKKECENIRIQKEYMLLAAKAIKKLS